MCSVSAVKWLFGKQKVFLNSKMVLVGSSTKCGKTPLSYSIFDYTVQLEAKTVTTISINKQNLKFKV